MKLPVKMSLFILICISVILYQYTLSEVWAAHQQNEAPAVAAAAAVDVVAASDEHVIVTSSENNTAVHASLPPLYIITPTYRRPEQIAELTRLSHTLRLVKNVHWLVIEDATVLTNMVAELLRRSGLSYVHLTAPMPSEYKRKPKGPRPRGVSNRNRGLKWIRENARKGVFYFADDDNTYDLDLFDEIRTTRRVSMFPVGLVTKLGVSSPVVRDGAFAGFYDGWMAGRKFPVDMGGFAVSVPFLLSRPKATMPYHPGFEEDGFLKSLKPFEPCDIEILASNCTKILVWHTQSKKNEPSLPVDMTKFNNTNILRLKQQLV